MAEIIQKIKYDNLPKTTTLKDNDMVMVSDGITSRTITADKLKNEIIKDVEVDTSDLATKTELTTGLSSKANVGHTHNEYATTTQLSTKADVSAIPTKISQLTNDSSFTTQTQVDTSVNTAISTSISSGGIKTELDKKADKVNTYTKAEVNSLIDGVNSGDVDLTNYYNKTETDNKLNNKSNVGHNHVIGDIANFPVLHTVATSGSYNDLTNKPTIPTVTNDLTATLKTNYDAAYTHSQQAHAPSNAEANVQSDWNVIDTNSDAYIKNKPNIPDVSDYYTKSETDQKIADVATGGTVDLGNYYNKQETYSKTEVDTAMIAKSDASHLHTGVYESVIATKNTAFNQNFETTTTNIKMNGTQSVGASNNVARADHVHPSDTTKVSTSVTVNAKPLSANIILNGADLLATGYVKATTQSAIATTDTINTALGKLEKKADDVTTSVSNKVDKVAGKSLISDTEITRLSSVTNYTHPTTSGSKHIPSGGASGQILGWESDGVAKWVDNTSSGSSGDADTVDGKHISDTMTQAEYDAMQNIDPDTIYLVEDNSPIVPEITTGDSGKILGVKIDGSGLEYIDKPIGEGSIGFEEFTDESINMQYPNIQQQVDTLSASLDTNTQQLKQTGKYLRDRSESETDDTTRLQELFNNARRENFKAIIPPGIYEITSTLYVDEINTNMSQYLYLTIEGQGNKGSYFGAISNRMGSVVFRRKGNWGEPLMLTNTTGLTIKNIVFDGNGYGTGLKADFLLEGLIEGCRFINCVRGLDGIAMQNTTINECNINRCQHGLLISESKNSKGVCNTVFINKTHIEHNTGYDLVVGKTITGSSTTIWCDFIYFNELHIEANSKTISSVLIGNCRHLSIDNSFILGSGTEMIKIQANLYESDIKTYGTHITNTQILGQTINDIVSDNTPNSLLVLGRGDMFTMTNCTLDIAKNSYVLISDSFGKDVFINNCITPSKRNGSTEIMIEDNRLGRNINTRRLTISPNNETIRQYVTELVPYGSGKYIDIVAHDEFNVDGTLKTPNKIMSIYSVLYNGNIVNRWGLFGKCTDQATLTGTTDTEKLANLITILKNYGILKS